MKTENNKIIAEFMNFDKVDNVRDSESNKYYNYHLPKNFNLVLEQEIQIESDYIYGLVSQDYVFLTDLVFHSDWNWLMEVVEKIKVIDNKAKEDFKTKLLHYQRNNKTIFDLSILEGKECIYNACLEFIKWYNENAAKTV